MEPPEPPSLAPGIAALFTAYSASPLPPTPPNAHRHVDPNADDLPPLPRYAASPPTMAAHSAAQARAAALAAALGAQPPGHTAMAMSPPGLGPTGDGVAVFDDIRLAAHHRVAKMLAAATQASELQVNAEIKKLEAGFGVLRSKIERVNAILKIREARTDKQDVLARMLGQVEQRWEDDIAAIKQELHQTILAHNHNADLMADHKAAIDKISAEAGARGQPQERGLDFDRQLTEQLRSLSRSLEQSEVQDQEVEVVLQRGEFLLQRYAGLGALSAMPTLPPPAMHAHPYAHSQPQAASAATAAALYGARAPPPPFHPGLASMVL